MENLDLQKNPAARRWALVVWPAFLTACVLEALVFAMVDPGEIRWLGHALQPSRKGVYTIAFFCFWLIVMASSRLVLYLAQRPSPTLNERRVD